MLKQGLLHPACPRRAETRPFPKFVLGSKASSMYRGDSAGLGRLRVRRVIMSVPNGAFFARGRAREGARLGAPGVGGCNDRSF